jgi:hypothetical protein
MFSSRIQVLRLSAARAVTQKPPASHTQAIDPSPRLRQSRGQIGTALRDAGEKTMKRNLTATIGAIALVAALAVTLRLAAQDSQDHNHHKQVRYSVKILGTLPGDQV